MIRRFLLSIVLAAAFLALTAGGSLAAPRSHQNPPGLRRSPARLDRRQAATVSVVGAVTTPATYTLSELATELPQTTFSVTHRWWWGSRTESDTGVSLEYLVNLAAPTLPSAKNALLRVTVTVSSAWQGPVTLALGELDPSFGSHAAYLALEQNGRALPQPRLVVDGDVKGGRYVSDVVDLVVGQGVAPFGPRAWSR